MAFLDNSGDIILDAVLTDTGRARLARGDGSFKITKFALGDDEIDYSSYNALHPSGTAYFDLEILQTPIFEAFTNNTSNMKSKLISLTNNNLLFLPKLVLNNTSLEANVAINSQGANFAPTRATLDGGQKGFAGSGSHVLMVDSDTVTAVNGRLGTVGESTRGYLNGASAQANNSNQIRVDQGLDTTEIDSSLILDPELKETQYIVEIDSRFAKIYDPNSTNTPVAQPSFIDDDQIASYYFTLNVGNFVENAVAGPTSGNNTVEAAKSNAQVIKGPRGTNLRFGLLASTDLAASDFLFTTLGSSFTDTDGTSAKTYDFIDTTIRVTGVTTGYRLDIPLRILKVRD
tara:strand:- start:2663 stop:3697 length:1035 start_codon:yes stop_codon:yes gene_type:complete